MSRTCWCGNCTECRSFLNYAVAGNAFQQSGDFHENNPHLATQFAVANFVLVLFFFPVGWGVDLKSTVVWATVAAALSPFWGLSITILTVMAGLLGIWVN